MRLVFLYSVFDIRFKLPMSYHYPPRIVEYILYKNLAPRHTEEPGLLLVLM